MSDWLIKVLGGHSDNDYISVCMIRLQLGTQLQFKEEQILNQRAQITELTEEIIRLRDKNHELQQTLIEIAKEKQVVKPPEETKLQAPAHAVRASWPRMRKAFEERDILNKLKQERGYVRTVNGDWVLPGKPDAN